jgi:glycerate kinase
VLIACDVDNPLTGPNGASAIFGPQKGATPADIPLLDARLGALRDRLGLAERPGDGAAGGACYGLRFLFPQARVCPGIDLVLDAIGFDRHLQGATLVVTGEGRMDEQTLHGKAVAGVASRARAAGVPVVALVGSLSANLTTEQLETLGVAAVMPLTPRPMTVEEAMQDAHRLLAEAAERTGQWLRLSVG